MHFLELHAAGSLQLAQEWVAGLLAQQQGQLGQQGMLQAMQGVQMQPYVVPRLAQQPQQQATQQPQQQQQPEGDLLSELTEASECAEAAARGLTHDLAARFAALLERLPPAERAVKVRLRLGGVP